jgi:hypothetical protein
LRDNYKVYTDFNIHKDSRNKAGGKGQYANTPQSFKQTLSDFYLQTDGTMLPNAVMVKMGKDEALRKNGGKGQTHR